MSPFRGIVCRAISYKPSYKWLLTPMGPQVGIGGEEGHMLQNGKVAEGNVDGFASTDIMLKSGNVMCVF